MRDPFRRLIDRLARRIAYEVHRDDPTPSRRDIYFAVAELRRRHHGEDAALTLSELSVFSQNGEDGVLAEIFGRIGTTNRFFVEFGVEGGLECNTRFLADVLGWSGIYIEPEDTAFESLRLRLSPRADITALHAAVTPDNINQLLKSAPVDLDLISIDVDGQDYWIWEALTSRPRVVVIEYNAALDPSSRLVEPKGTPWQARRTTFFGASQGAMVALGERKGYRLVHADMAGVNLFFVRDEFAGAFTDPLPRGMNIELRSRRHDEEHGDYVQV